jgi:tetratricopeptide (TPR) repeat protein
MGAYVREFESTEAEGGSRALALLQSLGLFDRPAEMKCLAALWSLPAIEGLTEPLAGLGEEDRNEVFTEPADPKLLTMNLDAGGEVTSLDAHPLLREFLANALRESRPEAWKAGHKRLYQHLTTMTPEKPAPTLDDLQPLYQAVAHGCHAGRYQEALDIYERRICRGTLGPGAFYSRMRLGAQSSDLAALRWFFVTPWNSPAVEFRDDQQAWLLSEVGARLRAVGRLTDARVPMEQNLDLRRLRLPNSVARAAANLSELDLQLGNLELAIQQGDLGVGVADRYGDNYLQLICRSALGDALAQAGRSVEAQTRFVEAEALQAERDAQRPRLYSLYGFRFWDLLLQDAECAVWRRVVDSHRTPPLLSSEPSRLEAHLDTLRAVGGRATEGLAIAEHYGWLLDVALAHLTLGRIALYGAILQGSSFENSESTSELHLDTAIQGLRQAGFVEHIPRGLLSRAFLRTVQRRPIDARADLNEADHLAERGPMPLHLADVCLHRARLFFRDDAVAAKAEIQAARTLIDMHGYRRRLQELEDTENAFFD